MQPGIDMQFLCFDGKHERGLDVKGNVARAQDLVRAITRAMAAHPRTPSPDGIETVLDTAILTAPDARDPALVAKLDAVAGRVLGQAPQK